MDIDPCYEHILEMHLGLAESYLYLNKPNDSKRHIKAYELGLEDFTDRRRLGVDSIVCLMELYHKVIRKRWDFEHPQFKD
jgi:hypothetical protein